MELMDKHWMAAAELIILNETMKMENNSQVQGDRWNKRHKEIHFRFIELEKAYSGQA